MRYSLPASRGARGALLALLVVAAGCSAPAPAVAPGPPSTAQPSRTLVIAIRVELPSVATKAPTESGLGLRTAPRLFNAGLVLDDTQGNPRPYLAEALPQVNTDTWRVLPDGRMETTYRLRPDLVWHDGVPLTSEDWIFAWRLYSASELGIRTMSPQELMEDMVAVDQRTFVIRWRQLFPHAGNLQAGGQAANFQALPRHILERPFQQEKETLASHAFWTTEYIGLGPFRLDRWEPGAFIEAVAFDKHVLGRPKIERVKLVFMSDPNTVVANLLAGEAHVTLDDTIRFQQAAILRREWAPRSGGSVLVGPGNWRLSQVQQRREFVNPVALLDLRVRKALMHAIDRNGLNEALFEGEGIVADSMIPPTASYFAAVDRAITKYPYDTGRAEALMVEAGYTRGPDGFFTSPAEGRPTFEIKVLASTQNESEVAIMAAGWRQAGFDIREVVLPALQAQDNQIRATFPSLFTTGATCCEESLPLMGGANTPRPENRWSGINRGGWLNADYDRLVEQLKSTLDREERARQVVQLATIYSDDLPGLSLFFNPAVVAHVAQVQGPQRFDPQGAGDPVVHEWAWR